MKKTFIFFAVLMLFTSSILAKPMDIYIDGKKSTLDCQIVEGHTLVEFRKLGELFNTDVAYQGSGYKEAYLNIPTGLVSVVLYNSPGAQGGLINGKTYIGLKYVCQEANFDINYVNGAVHISTHPAPKLTSEDKELITTYKNKVQSLYSEYLSLKSQQATLNSSTPNILESEFSTTYIDPKENLKLSFVDLSKRCSALEQETLRLINKQLPNGTTGDDCWTGRSIMSLIYKLSYHLNYSCTEIQYEYEFPEIKEINNILEQFYKSTLTLQ